MIDRWKRQAWSAWAGLSGRGARNRRTLYAGARGLRMLTLHETPPPDMDRFRKLVDWCRARHPIAGPEAADDLAEGRFQPAQVEDRVLFTFDDGMRDNYEAAKHLHEVGVRAIFFVIPSFVGRTVAEYHRYHREQGVEAYRIRSDSTLEGLRPAEIREMAAMGHRIAGHNFAHRDLGQLHRVEDLEYEVGRAMDTLSEILGEPCDDFAFGFGQPSRVSQEAAAYLTGRCKRVYACVRGLNVPGRTPRWFLRDHIDLSFPEGFIRRCLEGALDDRLQPEWRELARMGGLLPAARADVVA